MSLIISLLNLIGLKSYSFIPLIVMIITNLISGYIIGKKSIKKGYINGIALGLITTSLMFLLSLIFKNTYQINTVIYYLVIVVSTSIGSMFGIQKNNS
jgi:putative membrane protein (TIGR04086 family)